MKICIFNGHTNLTNNLLRILMENGVKTDIFKKVKFSVIENYDAVIFVEHSKIDKMYTLMEQFVLTKKIHVIFIASTESLGKIQKICSDFYFHRINRQILGVELPMLLRTIRKQNKYILALKTEISNLQKKIHEHETISKAKYLLMEKGMKESSAHMFIQRKAMDLRKSKYIIANLIIQNKIDIE